MDELREQAFQSLADVLRGPLTVERLRAWSHEDEERRMSLLDGRIFGSIRWPKQVGRSLGGTLASGFDIRHDYHELNWELRPGGQPVETSRWRAGAPPSVWDLPDDAEHYQVGFACWGVKPWENRVEVRLSDTQPWDTRFELEARRSYRLVVPAVQVLIMGGAPYGILDPMTVEERPIQRFGP
jgi:hypothetical protein